jgi:predicted DNA-binding transcriptional regulator YafY
MITTAERRLSLLHILCERREETIGNLAFELRVSRNTIKTDIFVLSLSYPLYTVQGRGGGARVVDGYYLGMKYLTKKQSDLLDRLLLKLEGSDKEILHTIIRTFKKPEYKNKIKK